MNFIEILGLCFSMEGKQLDAAIAEIQAINYANSRFDSVDPDTSIDNKNNEVKN